MGTKAESRRWKITGEDWIGLLPRSLQTRAAGHCLLEPIV